MTSRTKLQRKPPRYDFIALLASAVAICLSAIALYQSFGRPRDDLQVLVTKEPSVTPRKTNYEASGEHVVTFVNAGNREAAVISMQFLFVDVMEAGTNCENYAEKTIGGVFADYDLEPFSIGPGKIVVRNVKLRKPPQTNVVLEPMFQKAGAKPIEIMACYRFISVTAGVRSETLVPAGTWRYNADGTGVISHADDSKIHALLPR